MGVEGLGVEGLGDIEIVKVLGAENVLTESFDRVLPLQPDFEFVAVLGWGNVGWAGGRSRLGWAGGWELGKL